MFVGLHFRLLSRSECAAVVSSAAQCRNEPARLSTGLSPRRTGTVTWLPRRADTAWIYERLERLCSAYTTRSGIEVSSVEEPLQIAEYAVGNHFDWHIDLEPRDRLVRKVTAVVQLSDAHSYAGGDLEFVGFERSLWRRAIGSVTVFPAVLGHRVTPLESGIRRVLVMWLRGPPFR